MLLLDSGPSGVAFDRTVATRHGSSFTGGAGAAATCWGPLRGLSSCPVRASPENGKFSTAPVKEVIRRERIRSKQHSRVSQRPGLRPGQTARGPAQRVGPCATVIIASPNDRPVTDGVRLAIESWIKKTKSDPNVQRSAHEVRADVGRRASTKRDAIAAIFDAGTPIRRRPGPGRVRRLTAHTRTPHPLVCVLQPPKEPARVPGCSRKGERS